MGRSRRGNGWQHVAPLDDSRWFGHPAIGSAPLIPECHVTTSLADLRDTNLPTRRDGLLAENNRERGTHAGIRKVVMVGGSSESGRSSPARCRPSASSRFARASSTVSP